LAENDRSFHFVDLLGQTFSSPVAGHGAVEDQPGCGVGNHKGQFVPGVFRVESLPDAADRRGGQEVDEEVEPGVAQEGHSVTPG